MRKLITAKIAQLYSNNPELIALKPETIFSDLMEFYYETTNKPIPIAFSTLDPLT